MPVCVCLYIIYIYIYIYIRKCFISLLFRFSLNSMDHSSGLYQTIPLYL